MKNIKSKYVFLLFIVIAVAQLFVPAQMIFGQEEILTKGKAYKFKTQPIDPSDPYRGKYITLRYDMNSAVSNDSIWERKQEVYVYIKEDSLGFAELVEVSKAPINTENDFVIAELRSNYSNPHKVFFNLPFDRFYMEESKAKPAEDAFRKAQRDALPNNTYALVYIKDGDAVLKDVLINEISIADYVEE
ncbi:GDYXXLXY domain-containing protein [Lacinutrix jangbogonensis]|uniref:GDYXXLXY domain-containing protein n=1 Tax=Lacinutrix jangbogonensis TaxID=1469557 RepID=UPI00053CFBAF|nr:GDYXXLXY domain-containing protein [Lacinutrix jangbogonensis]